MPVVGSTITVDLHVTEDADLDSVQAVVRQSESVHPDLASTIRDAVQKRTQDALDDIDGYDLSVEVKLETGRLPGAPRERITATLDVEGDNPVVAAIDDAVSAPERAQIADTVEDVVQSYLRENDLPSGADIIVSVTPIQFR